MSKLINGHADCPQLNKPYIFDDVLAALKALGYPATQLYAAGTVNRPPLRPYLTMLVESLERLYNTQSGPMTLAIEIDELELAPEVAAPLGLILNEFTTNSLKYAFDGEGGTITVHVKGQDNRLTSVCLSDNGKGLPATAHSPRSGSGTGMKLIEGLARQIKAKPRWSTKEGTVLDLEFVAR